MTSSSRKCLVLINAMSVATVLYIGNGLLVNKGRRYLTASESALHSNDSILIISRSDREHFASSEPVQRYHTFVEALTARADSDRYIILAMADEAFTDMAINFYEASLRAHHVHNFLFVGVGHRTCETLWNMSIPCFYYADDPSAGKVTGFGQLAFIRKMNIRTDMILEALAANFTVIHSDIDIAFLVNPVPEVKETMTNTDVAPLWDATVYNAGFIIIRPTPPGIRLYLTIRNQTQRSKKLADQQSLNVVIRQLKNRKATFRMHILNKRRFQSGHVYFELSGRLFPKDKDCSPSESPNCPIVVHNNWIVSKNAKIYRFREHLMWLYDGDDRYYSSETRNYLTYTNPPEVVVGHQLSALISALAIGHLLNRVVILPRFLCGTGPAYSCPLNSLIRISNFDAYFKDRYRESSFLSHPKVPDAVKRGIYDGTKVLNWNSTTSVRVTSRKLKQLFGEITARVLKLGILFRVNIIFHDKQENKIFNENVQKAIKRAVYRQY